jgi:hypothetical protein
LEEVVLIYGEGLPEAIVIWKTLENVAVERVIY